MYRFYIVQINWLKQQVILFSENELCKEKY